MKNETYEDEKERFEGEMYAQKAINLNDKNVNFELFAQVMSDGLSIEYVIFLDKQEHDGGFYDMPQRDWEVIDKTAQKVFNEIIDNEINYLLKGG